MNKKIIGLVTISIFVATGAYFYYKYSTSKDLGELVYMYDFGDKKAYIQKPVLTKVTNGDSIKMLWLKIVDPDGSYQQNRLEMNCKSEMVRGVQYSRFTKEGQNIDSSPYVETDWAVVVPDTNYRLVLNYVCK